MQEIENSEIKINIREVCSELAELHLIREHRDINTDEELEKLIWIEKDNVITYTEYAQDQFNILYDLYYDLLEKLKL